MALLQLLPFGDDQDSNLAKGLDYCLRAKTLGADVVLFPEMWNTGYSGCDPAEPASVQHWKNQAVPLDGAFITAFRTLAARQELAVGITFLEETPQGPRNSLALIDRSGEVVLRYSKVHTCDFGWESCLARGECFDVTCLDTAAGEVQVGAMICYDREFPESARVLMLKGAEIILTPNACELEQNRLSQYRARAYENMLGLAMANYPAPQENGMSVAYDGIAFDENGSRDMTLVDAGPEEGIYLAHFNLNRLRAYRSNEAWGNAFRRPEMYREILEKEIKEPFHRKEARR